MLWDVKGNKAKGKSREARDINLALDNIKAQIIKHYRRISDRETFVTAEMVRNAYQGIGMEYETLLKAFDRENEVFKKRVGKDRVMATYRFRMVSRNYAAAFIKSFYKRNDMSMLELTPPRLHQGVCRIPFNGSRAAQWNDMGKMYVAQRRGDACAFQRIDTAAQFCRHFQQRAFAVIMCPGLPFVGEKALALKVAVELLGKLHAHIVENVGF